MKNFIAYNKLSKKQKRKVNQAKRILWTDYGCMCCVSKIVPDKKKASDRGKCRAVVRNYDEI